MNRIAEMLAAECEEQPVVRTLPGRLAAELARVAGLRERVSMLAGDPLLNVRPMLRLLGGALARGITAAGSQDAVEQLAALHELQSFHS